MINGFGFSGYRSIGDELVKIAPLKKINLIIGQNNSGKSNIITFLKNHYSSLADYIKSRTSTAYSSFSDTDKHISNKPIKTRIAFCLDTNSEDYDNHVNSKIPNEQHFKGLIDKLLKSPFFKDNSGLVWFIYESAQPNGQYNL
jgi:AAA15 family ATPase/GTPase